MIGVGKMYGGFVGSLIGARKGVGVSVGIGVGVSVGVGEAVGEGVGDSVAVSEGVTVAIGSSVAVGVADEFTVCHVTNASSQTNNTHNANSNKMTAPISDRSFGLVAGLSPEFLKFAFHLRGNVRLGCLNT